MGSRRGGIKRSALSRSSQYLPACRSNFRGVSPLSVPLSTQSKGYSQPSLTLYLSCTLLLAHCQRQATHLAFARSSASHLSHLHQQGPSSPDPVSPSQASSIRITVLLCRKQARREAITYKSLSVANETNRLVINQTTVSSSERHSSHLQRWF